MTTNNNYTCPNCGAQTNKAICEYCGSVVTPPQEPKKRSKSNEAIYVLPWSKKLQTDDDIIVKCLSHIRNMKDAPLDVFEHITDVQVTRFYLPMRYFKGNVTTDWNCIQVFDRKRIVGYDYDRDGKKKPIYENYEEYIPASGKGAANFSFVVPTVNKAVLPKALVDCLGTMSLDKDIAEKAQALDASLIVDGATIIDEEDRGNDKTIIKAAEKYIDNVADRASFKNLSGRLQDCNYTYNWRYGSAQNKRLLVPASIVSYKYKGEQYTYAFIYNGDGFNGDSKKEYPKGDVEILQQVKSQSHSYTKTVWLTFILSLLLTLVILFLWGDMTPKIYRLGSIFGSIIILIIVAWKALSISVTYDNITKMGEELATVKRTEGLKRAFPKYANHPSVNKVAAEESDIQHKIRTCYSTIRSSRLVLKILLIVQALIIIGGFVNMNRVAENKRAAYRAEQERILEQERQEQQRQAEEKRIEQEKFEEEQRQLEPTKKWILSQLVGKTYTGECWMNKDGIRISFLNENTLQFSTTAKFQHDRSNWSEPISFPYTIDIKKKSYGASSWYNVVIRSSEFHSDEIDIFDEKFNSYELQIKYNDENYTLHRNA